MNRIAASAIFLLCIVSARVHAQEFERQAERLVLTTGQQASLALQQSRNRMPLSDFRAWLGERVAAVRQDFTETMRASYGELQGKKDTDASEMPADEDVAACSRGEVGRCWPAHLKIVNKVIEANQVVARALQRFDALGDSWVLRRAPFSPAYRRLLDDLAAAVPAKPKSERDHFLETVKTLFPQEFSEALFSRKTQSYRNMTYKLGLYARVDYNANELNPHILAEDLCFVKRRYEEAQAAKRGMECDLHALDSEYEFLLIMVRDETLSPEDHEVARFFNRWNWLISTYSL